MITIVTITEFARENYWTTIIITSYDNDSLIFDMQITKMSIFDQNINSKTNDFLSRCFDKPQYCTSGHFTPLKKDAKKIAREPREPGI